MASAVRKKKSIYTWFHTLLLHQKMRSFLLLSAFASTFASAFASASTVPQDMQSAGCTWDGSKIVCPMGANLSSANLSGADLSGADLSGANLYGAFLSNAILKSANLYGALLSNAILKSADLSGADLRNANLEKADLRNANMWDVFINERTEGVPAFAFPSRETFDFDDDEVVYYSNELVSYAKDLLSRADASQLSEILSDVDLADLAAAYQERAVAQACQ